MYYVLTYIVSYILPITYYVVRYGFIKTEERSSIVLPILFISLLGVLRIAMDIPEWVKTWEPSFKKGLVRNVPKILLFVFFMTFGLSLKYIIYKQIDSWFYSYFETVLVVFGGLFAGSFLDAMHLMYKEKYLISKGYVLGVVNR